MAMVNVYFETETCILTGGASFKSVFVHSTLTPYFVRIVVGALMYPKITEVGDWNVWIALYCILPGLMRLKMYRIRFNHFGFGIAFEL